MVGLGLGLVSSDGNVNGELPSCAACGLPGGRWLATDARQAFLTVIMRGTVCGVRSEGFLSQTPNGYFCLKQRSV